MTTYDMLEDKIIITPPAPINEVLSSESIGQGFEFNCSACGKCCSSGPQMTFAEAFELRDVFVQRLFITVKKYDYGESLEHVKYAHGLGIPIRNELLNYCHKICFIAPGVISYDNKCPALNLDTLCSIYDKRPSICKSVPFSTLPLDENKVINLIAFGKKYGCVTQKEGACIPVDGLHENQTAIHLDTDYSEAIYRLLEGLNFEFISGIRTIGSHFIAMAIDGYDHLHGGPTDRPKLYAEAQIKLLEKEVAAAKVRKNKSELQITRQYQDMIRDLKIYLDK